MDFVNKVISSVTPSKEEPKAAEPSAAAKAATDAKEKAAGATGDALSSVKDKGNLDETKGVGKAVDQAEVNVRKHENHSLFK